MIYSECGPNRAGRGAGARGHKQQEEKNECFRHGRTARPFAVRPAAAVCVQFKKYWYPAVSLCAPLGRP
jgi:hypothetical protein